MTAIPPAILAKIRALRALATSANEHEARAAAAQAEALLQKHRLTEADLEAADPKRAEAIGEAADPLDEASTRLDGWRRALCTVLARHYGCAVYSESNTLSRRVRVRIVGRPGDVAIVRYMHAWLRAEIVRLCAANAHGRAARAAYCLGAVVGYREALERGRKAAEAEHDTSAAIVLASRAAEAERHLDGLYANMRTVKRASRVTDGAAFEAGRRDGQRLDRGVELPGPGTRALPPRS